MSAKNPSDVFPPTGQTRDFDQLARYMTNEFADRPADISKYNATTTRYAVDMQRRGMPVNAESLFLINSAVNTMHQTSLATTTARFSRTVGELPRVAGRLLESEMEFK